MVVDFKSRRCRKLAEFWSRPYRLLCDDCGAVRFILLLVIFYLSTAVLSGPPLVKHQPENTWIFTLNDEDKIDIDVCRKWKTKIQNLEF